MGQTEEMAACKLSPDVVSFNAAIKTTEVLR